jgi:hypothetical protein
MYPRSFSINTGLSCCLKAAVPCRFCNRIYHATIRPATKVFNRGLRSQRESSQRTSKMLCAPLISRASLLTQRFTPSAIFNTLLLIRSRDNAPHSTEIFPHQPQQSLDQKLLPDCPLSLNWKTLPFAISYSGAWLDFNSPANPGEAQGRDQPTSLLACQIQDKSKNSLIGYQCSLSPL